MNHSIFGGGGSAMFVSGDKWLFLAYVNSRVSEYFLSLMNPTLNFLVGDILSLPVITDKTKENDIGILVQDNISLSKSDWDSFETSWDFKRHPLV